MSIPTPLRAPEPATEPARPATRLPSLRTRLARHVLLPLGLVWLVGTAIATSVAYYYAQQAFDRGLLDDAFALAANVQTGPQGVQLKLTESELKALLFDQSESVFFAVRRFDGSLVSGHAWLRAPAPAAAETPQSSNQITTTTEKKFDFSNTSHQGNPLRVVSVDRPAADIRLTFQVVMAQTTHSRTELLQRVLLFSLVPQAALLLLLAWWLRRAIGTDLHPLASLQRALDQRDTHDLSPVAVQASTRDVQQLGGAINSLMARVEAGVQAQREFAGNVAHELRTPLAGIRALAEYGLAQSNPQVWQQQLIAVSASEARASHMVAQLLALALADETRDSLRLVPVALDALVRRVVLQAMPRADALGVDLGARAIDEPISVHADVGLIEGVLNNLLDNALRYGKPPVGTAPAITVELHQTADTVSMHVTDNGPGIAEGQRQDMMRRWQRAGGGIGADAGHGVSTGLGTGTGAGIEAGHGVGLGLAIVARYAALLGACFELTNGDSDSTAQPSTGTGLSAGLVWTIENRASAASSQQSASLHEPAVADDQRLPRQRI